ncbi:MAG: hypothetical protein AMXMBFR33_16710 [Candidatus Xenobia bacterium]
MKIMPRAIEGLIVSPVGDGDSVVFNKQQNRVHSLNAVAARVLSACDGVTPMSDVVQALAPAYGDSTEDVLWLTLRRLQSSGLLATPLPGNGLSSRREFLGKWGKIAAALPIVASIAAPAPAAAQSAGCGFFGDPCPCCPGFGLACVGGICTAT